MLRGPSGQFFAPGFLAEIDELERCLPRGRSVQLVLTHGDLHAGNLLDGIEAGGATDSKLWAIDLELAGARPCETDLSYLFIMMGLGHAMRAYPSVNARWQFVKAYLAERGLPHNDEAVDDMLFRIELEWPFQALFACCAAILTSGDGTLAGRTLPVMPQVRSTLVAAKASADLRAAVVASGAVGAAIAGAHAAGMSARSTGGYADAGNSTGWQIGGGWRGWQQQPPVQAQAPRLTPSAEERRRAAAAAAERRAVVAAVGQS
eukprot:gb/GFBE01057976.1/.p1 GENE.gb/GFBE01057976.1/~~gb/GFBE01057976.1/.p1  ORF type:complete len:262 (+),score=35.93 gb/GFBE01057976.1/:1-786(+)